MLLIQPILQRHWFLLVLGVILVLGMAFPEQSAPFAFVVPKDAVIAIVLLVMSLPLEFDAMWHSLRRPAPSLLATFVSFVVLPLLAWPVSLFFQADLAAGLIIASAVPCSMASVTVWTRMAGGNEAVSMLVTVITNVACFLVTPAWVWFLVGHETESESFTELAIILFVVVVLPIIAGQMLRLIPGVAAWAKRFKTPLSIMAQLGVLMIVFMGAVFSGVQLRDLEGEWGEVAFQIVMVMVCVALLHLAAWWIGFLAAKEVGMNREDRIAVAFGGSQKTLMVGLAIALSIGGLAILPMLAYHVEQLLIGTVLAGKLQRASAATGVASKR